MQRSFGERDQLQRARAANLSDDEEKPPAKKARVEPVALFSNEAEPPLKLHAAPPAAPPPSYNHNSFKAQLDATDWGSVPGLADALPQVQPGFPVASKVLHAFELTSPAEVKCVLVGKVPYETGNLAMGLALSVPDGQKKPQTLTHHLLPHLKTKMPHFRNIKPTSGDLTPWATRAGVLMLNASLQGQNARPWQPFLQSVIKALCAKADGAQVPVGFIFMGAEAKVLAPFVQGISKCCVVEAVFPGRYTRDEWVATFPFPRVDAALQANGAQRIRWEVLLEHETKPPRKSGGGKSAGAGQAAASSSAAPAPAEVIDGSLVVD